MGFLLTLRTNISSSAGRGKRDRFDVNTLSHCTPVAGALFAGQAPIGDSAEAERFNYVYTPSSRFSQPAFAQIVCRFAAESRSGRSAAAAPNVHG